MDNCRIYIINEISVAAEYGIGTYIRELQWCLNNIGFHFELIQLPSSEKEVTISEIDGRRQINIPYTLNNKSEINKDENYFRNVAYLLREFINDEPGVIFHMNYMNNKHLLYWIRKLFVNCKIVLTIHYTEWSILFLGDFNRLKKTLKKEKEDCDSLERYIIDSMKENVEMLKLCDKAIIISKHTLAAFEYYDRKIINKLCLINNALSDSYKKISNNQKDRIKIKYGIPENVRIILFAGRLTDVKGIYFLLEAFKDVLKSHTNVHLFIAGDGDFEKWIVQSANAWINVTFTGKLNKKKLSEFYSIADIGIVPSIHEEFGYVAIEMMMNELPVIVTDTSGLGEIVDDDLSGLKVPVEKLKGQRQVNIQIMSDKIRQLLDNPDFAQKLGERGRKHFLEKYSMPVFEDKMKYFYNNI